MDSSASERRREHVAGNTPISNMGLSVRAKNALHRAGYRTELDVSRMNAEDVSLLKNVGVVTLGEIRRALESRGMSLSDSAT